MAAIDLYWLPLGAGGHSVRLNGKVFEGVRGAARAPRPLRPLPLGTPGVRARGQVRDRAGTCWGEGARRGVVAEGAVGAQALGRFRLFRYEIRSWRDGIIPDIAEAVESPRRLSDDLELAQAAARTRAAGADARLGPRRAGCRRDVELELDDLMASRRERPRRRVDLASRAADELPAGTLASQSHTGSSHEQQAVHGPNMLT